MFIFGCKKYIDFDEEIKESKIVVNGFVQNNEPALIHISRSLSVIDNASLNVINNATIKLFDGNGNFIENLGPFEDTIYQTNQTGMYRGTTLLNANSKYKIEVSAPSYKAVSSSTYIPEFNLTQTAPPDTLSVIDNQFDGANTSFTFHFSDNGNEENYYGIKAYGIHSSSDPIAIWMNTDDANIENKYGDELLFKDDFVNGSVFDLKIKLPTNYYGNPYSDTLYIDTEKYDSIRFELNSYSRDMYLYKKSYQAYQNVDPFFSQPVQVYSNIENGMGVFGGIKEDVFSIAIE